MAAIVLKGANKLYIFSVVTPDHQNMPDWGGIYIAVNASVLGMRMENIVAIGSSTNFQKYQDKIFNFLDGKCTHIYLLPEADKQNRSFAMEDLAQTEAFREAMERMSQEDTVPELLETA